ncbi:MAG: histidine phosphatase family protein [Pseudomonadota bacterium]|nr:histidine phosphatase family protein [Pseudomonadota bacterium]
MEIGILRHGKPDYVNEASMSANGFKDWIKNYNDSGLSATSFPSESILAYAKGYKVILSSTLPRSIDSAKALDARKLVLVESIFVEAGLPSSDWTFLKLSPKTWSAIFRILWLFGYSQNSESLKEAKERAKKSADYIIQLASEHQKVLFVGHGIFNRLIVKELIKRGWSGPKTLGLNYWSHGSYRKS